MATPDYYLPIMPYLIVDQADQFTDFIRQVFGAEERLMTRRADGTVQHAEFSFSKATIMLSEANANCAAFPGNMFVLLNDIDAIYEKALANGATSLHPPSDLEYGRSAGFQDGSGNQWWITEPVTE